MVRAISFWLRLKHRRAVVSFKWRAFGTLRHPSTSSSEADTFIKQADTAYISHTSAATYTRRYVEHIGLTATAIQ